jgi:hypothetical protein
VKNLETVLREKEQQVETLQQEIEALKFVATLLSEEGSTAEESPKITIASGLASTPAPTHVMQSSAAASFDRELGGYSGASTGLKQFP